MTERALWRAFTTATLAAALVATLLLGGGARQAAAGGPCAGRPTGFYQLGTPAARDKGTIGIQAQGLAATGGQGGTYQVMAAIDGAVARVWTENTGWLTYALPAGVIPAGPPAVQVSDGEVKVWFVSMNYGPGDGYGPRDAWLLATGLDWCP